MNKNKCIFVLLTALVAMILPSCKGAEPSREINVLCTTPEELCQGMKLKFEASHSITVNYVRISSGEALARLQAEKGNPQFDIWWGGPIDSFVAAKQEGLLEAYNSQNYKNLLDQEKYKDPDNYWAGIYVGSLGFCTNTNWLAANPGAKPPTSWDDLLRPEFTDQIMIAHPSTSGTAYTALVTILLVKGEEAGWEYLRNLAGQVFQFTETGRAPIEFVGQGEAAIGIAYAHEIVYEIEVNRLPLTLTFPEDGTGYIIGGMGIIKGAQHPDTARMWFDWALTADAQSAYPNYGAYQAPTVYGVKLTHPELLQVKLVDYDFQWAGEHHNEFVDRFTNEISGASNLRK